jgi:hypothetical protein
MTLKTTLEQIDALDREPATTAEKMNYPFRFREVGPDLVHDARRAHELQAELMLVRARLVSACKFIIDTTPRDAWQSQLAHDVLAEQCKAMEEAT